MAENKELESAIETEESRPLQTRIEELSSKVKTTAQERDEKDRLLKEAETKSQAAEKERDFYASFADSVGKYPGAKDHKDEIKAKVLAGYDVEDATVSVLNKAGKLTTATVREVSPAGGSATISPTLGQKSATDLTQTERRQQLMEAEARGDISLS